MRNLPFQYDFRSDTVTQPSAGMKSAMVTADLGDDVFGDDPTVQELEQRLAGLTGKAAGLFLPSGTQSNLSALMAHCDRGDEYIVGQRAHCYLLEAGGAAVLGSIQPHPLPHCEDGSLDLDEVASVIKPDDSHYAITRLLTIENTHAGKVLSLDYMHSAAALAADQGIGIHLDGARAFNAAAALSVPISDVAAPFDTVSLCLSKGLGAPIGSVLVGSQPLIDKARRIRKMLGGGLRQVGILAAAGLYAIEHNVDRLSDDHENASHLSSLLSDLDGFDVSPASTNMVYVKMATERADSLIAYLAAQGIGLAGTYGQLRLVTHLDVDRTAVETLVRHVKNWIRQ